MYTVQKSTTHRNAYNNTTQATKYKNQPLKKVFTYKLP